jgi:hypothetical protein
MRHVERDSWQRVVHDQAFQPDHQAFQSDPERDGAGFMTKPFSQITKPFSQIQSATALDSTIAA